MELIKTDERADEVSSEELPVNTALDAVRPENVMVPEDVIPVAPVITPAPEMSIDGVLRKVSQFEPMLMAVSVADVPAARPSILIA
jgi:hypothetical protein